MPVDTIEFLFVPFAVIAFSKTNKTAKKVNKKQVKTWTSPSDLRIAGINGSRL